MSKQPVDDQIIIDYLLGVLPEVEMKRLDEMSVSDDSFVERLSAVENDLVDSYVRGELSGEALDRFKSHYMASPKRREKVAFAETFCRMVDESTFDPIKKPSIAAESDKPGSFSYFVISRPAFQWGLAVVSFLLLVAGSYLMFENVTLRKQISRTQEDHSALEQRERELQGQLTLQRSSDAEKEKELARVRDRLAQVEQQILTTQQRDVKIVALTLSPQTRGVSRMPLLAVPEGTDYVALTLSLEVYDFPAYQLTLKNPATDKVLWRSNKLSGIGRKVTRVTMPASNLTAQNYMLEFFGISASGLAEIIISYPLKVVRE